MLIFGAILLIIFGLISHPKLLPNNKTLEAIIDFFENNRVWLGLIGVLIALILLARLFVFLFSLKLILLFIASLFMLLSGLVMFLPKLIQLPENVFTVVLRDIGLFLEKTFFRPHANLISYISFGMAVICLILASVLTWSTK